METTQILTIISLSCLFISLVSSFLAKIPVVVKNVFFLIAVVLLATSQVIKYIPEEMSDENFNFLLNRGFLKVLENGMRSDFDLSEYAQHRIPLWGEGNSWRRIYMKLVGHPDLVKWNDKIWLAKWYRSNNIPGPPIVYMSNKNPKVSEYLEGSPRRKTLVVKPSHLSGSRSIYKITPDNTIECIANDIDKVEDRDKLPISLVELDEKMSEAWNKKALWEDEPTQKVPSGVIIEEFISQEEICIYCIWGLCCGIRWCIPKGHNNDPSKPEIVIPINAKTLQPEGKDIDKLPKWWEEAKHLAETTAVKAGVDYVRIDCANHDGHTSIREFTWNPGNTFTEKSLISSSPWLYMISDGYKWLKYNNSTVDLIKLKRDNNSINNSTVDLIKDLVIIAHPDDESIWVGEILGPLCAVILVTCENETRFNEFKQVMDKTGVKNWQILNFPQQDYRKETSLWKIKDLIPKVRKVMKSFPDLENIYTHNANGEYGHPDHKSVHQAVTAAYAQEYNLDDNKPELYVFAPNGVTYKQGYPNSGCTCTESSLRKSLIDIYDEKLKGTQSVQQFRNLCPRVRNISSQILSNYSNKTLSLCIPCIPKHVKHLKELSKNINEQSVLPEEVIIAISNSDRYTKNQIRKIFQNLRTKLIITDVSHKALAGENRNRAVKFATSDIVSFMDADDLMHKQRIEILKYHFNKSNAIAIFHKFKHGNPIGKINVKNIKLDSDILIKAHKDKSTIYLKINDITHGHVSCLRSIFNKLKQDINNTERREDSKFARDLMDNFDQKRIYLINENLSNYRHQFSSQY